MPLYDFKKYLEVIRPYSEGDVSAYGIPVVKAKPVDVANIGNGLTLISLNNAARRCAHPRSRIVHSFKYDDVLLRFYNNPIKLLRTVGKYHAFCTLDFSMHPGMSTAQIIDATIKNRWSGALALAYGIDVIITVGWVKRDTFDITFAGIEDGSTLIISTLGVNNPDSLPPFLDGYHEMRKRFPHSTILCVGQRVPGMDDDVCYIDYQDSFGFDDPKEYQGKLFGWSYMGGDDVL